MLFLTGCDKYARHRYLTFFFTGVPHPDSENIIEEESGLTPEEILQKKKEDFTIPSYVHGPFASQQCYQCHSTSSSATFRFFGEEKKKGPTVAAAQNISSRLVMPIKELCIDCHTGKSVNSAYGKGLWVHGPVSEGICDVCHGPHSSPFPYLLRKGDSREMCGSCHAPGFIMASEDHEKDEDCTSCHNPHIGINRFLLRKDFDEASLR
jgi:predicted CXXCH cytochrome family protein